MHCSESDSLASVLCAVQFVDISVLETKKTETKLLMTNYISLRKNKSP